MFCDYNNFPDSESKPLTIEEEIENFSMAVRFKSLSIPLGVPKEKIRWFESVKKWYYLDNDLKETTIRRLKLIKKKLGGKEMVRKIIDRLWKNLATV